MRFFYYTWYENSADDLNESLARLGYQVVKCHIPLKNYEEDTDFCENFIRIFRLQYFGSRTVMSSLALTFFRYWRSLRRSWL